MTTITTRAAKGTPLTNDEIDANFTGLNADKLEKAGGTVSGALTVNGAFSVSYSTNAFVAATVTNTNAGAAASAVSRLLSNSGSLWLTSKRCTVVSTTRSSCRC